MPHPAVTVTEVNSRLQCNERSECTVFSGAGITYKRALAEYLTLMAVKVIQVAPLASYITNV